MDLSLENSLSTCSLMKIPTKAQLCAAHKQMPQIIKVHFSFSISDSQLLLNIGNLLLSKLIYFVQLYIDNSMFTTQALD